MADHPTRDRTAPDSRRAYRSLAEAEAEVDGLTRENLELREQLAGQAAESRKLAAELRKTLDDRHKREQTYKENREIYLLAIEATNLGIYDTKVKDEDFKLKENWLARLGYDPTLAHDEVLTWESLIHPDDYERVTRLFQQEIDGEINSLKMEYRLKAANGEWRWIIESSKVIRDDCADGQVRIVGTHFDITQRRLAEEAEREQRAFAEALSASTALFNSTLDLNVLLNLILVHANKVVPHDDADIWLIDSSFRNVRPALRKDMDGRLISTSSFSMALEDVEIFEEIAETRKSVYLPDVRPDSCPIPSRNPDSRSCICAPVSFGEYLLGFLVLNSSKVNFFTPIQVERLQAFANQAAVAIRNAQLYAQAQEAAALEERQRLAREMHDVISQTLFSATIKAEALPYLFEIEEPEEIKQNLAELYRLTRGALAEMRTMLMELRPNTIVNTDFGNLLRQMVDGLAGRTTADITVSAVGHGLLPPEVQTAFFRITQEALNNMLKHSRADKVEISFTNQKESAGLRVKDNGVGFDQKSVPVERMGVKIMRERAEAIGAKFNISSKAGHGTLIEVRWKNVSDGSAIQ